MRRFQTPTLPLGLHASQAWREKSLTVGTALGQERGAQHHFPEGQPICIQQTLVSV